MENTKRQAVNFIANIPVTVVLETKPSEAKRSDKVGNWGPYSFWTYFLEQGGILFAKEDLHNALQTYDAGETITITKVVMPGQKGGTWKIDKGGTPTPIATSQPGGQSLDAVMQKLSEIEGLIRQLLKQEPEEPAKETIIPDLGF